MRVLWLTPGASKYKNEKLGYYGGGWIESLQTLLENSKEIDQLGIAFPHPTDSKKTIIENVIYYPIEKNKINNPILKVISNWKAAINPTKEIQTLKVILEDFKPDVIHIFGTETWLCHVIKMTDIPCVVHLQGLLLPYVNAFNPIEISSLNLINISWKDFITGGNFWHNKRVLKKKSKREYQFFKDISFFMGRTDWDKSISNFLSPKSRYFHVNEVLREIFYSAKPWNNYSTNKIIITTTISDSPYKGLDLVIKTSQILIKEGIEFEWRIIGINNNSNSAHLFKNYFITKYSYEKIKLLGIKNADEIVGLLSETTIYVHPSYIDNSPNSLCEALLLGVPVIATYVGGVPSLIENSKDGFLVPANDPYLLAAKIYQFANKEIDLKQISLAARQKALNRHSQEKILNTIIKTYNFLLKN
jgi:glycosyltransferase involved in cell wall biosynthesis